MLIILPFVNMCSKKNLGGDYLNYMENDKV